MKFYAFAIYIIINPMERYIKIKTLRKTLFGYVILAMDNNTQKKVVVKMSRIKHIGKNTLSENPISEIKIMQQMENKCDYVISYYDSHMTDTRAYLILPYIDGCDLFDYLTTYELMHTDDALLYFCQLILAVRHLHKQNIAHLDISLENIMESNGQIVLFDFGQAVHGDEKLKEPHGKPTTMTPEMFQKIPYNSKQADIWTIGLVLYSLLTRSSAFQYANVRDPHYKIFFEQGISALCKYTRANVSDENCKLLELMLCPESKRASIDDLFKLPMLQTYFKKLSIAKQHQCHTPNPTPIPNQTLPS